MIIDTQLDIIFRCYDCESINGTPLSMFDLRPGSEIEFKSSCCRVKSVTVRQMSAEKYRITLVCPVCSQEHSYDISFGELWSSGEKYFSCKETGLKVLAIADYKCTERVIDTLDEEFHGFEEIFNESLSDDDRLLVSALNALNDLAIEEKISCECSNKDIVFELTEENLILKCPVCGTSQEISVSDIMFLEKIIASDEFVIEKSAKDSEKRAKILEFKTKR